MSNPKRPPTSPPIQTGNDGSYSEPLVAPVNGRVSSPFGPRSASIGAGSTHKGVDIAVPQGTPVKSAASGTVEIASGGHSGYGNEIKIRHDDSTETVYGHLSSIDVKPGDRVVSGEIIGKSGGKPGTAGAGDSRGAHLHYEVLKNGVAVNPLSKTKIIPGQNADQQIKQEAKERAISLNYNQDDIIRTLISGDHFQDNVLHKYDNLTYHWRLFMTGDQEIVDAQTTQSDSLSGFYSKLNSLDQVTLAESGVTSYSIDEVTMDAVVGTDFQTESTKFTSIEMKITEPNGVNFLDSLRNAGIQLGVRNYQKCFYYLELTFKGYEENGDINLKPFDGMMPNNGRWLWTVNISDIQVALSAGGGSYTLSMIPMTDSLLTGTYNLVPTTLHPSGSTVGEFFDNLCLQLNNVWAKIKGDSGIVVYKTQFHPVKDLMTADEVRAMSVTPNQEDLSPTQGFDFRANTNTAYIMPGFTLSRVLDSLMKACEKAQDLAKDSVQDANTVNDSENKINAKGYRQSILWRMEPEVHTPDYDPVYNEYYHHITLHIYGFRNHAAVLSPQDTTNDKDTQKAILADMAKRNFLPKKYEYIFTGVNSEVIDMDLTFNLAWQALLPSLASNTQEQVAPQAQVDPKTQRASALPQQQRGNTVSVQQAGADLQSAARDTADLSNQLNAARLEPPTPENLAKVAELKKKYDAAESNRLKQQQVVHEQRAVLNANRPASLPQNNFGRSFGEDLTNQRTVFTDQQQREAFPITVQTFDPNDASGMPGQFHNGKSIYGAVLNQVYGPLAKQFFQVSITIMGDPFWIGAGSFEQAIYRKSETWENTIPNYSEGVNCFMFKMKYPLGQDSDGNIVLNVNESVTGIYQVNKVTHRFSEGKFTQVLSAIRVPIIDLYQSMYDSLYPNQVKSVEDGSE